MPARRLSQRHYSGGAIQVRRRDRSVSSAQGVQYDHWSNTAGKTCVGLVDRNALKKSAYWLILGPTIALTCIGVVMVLSASSVEFIGGAGSFAFLSSQGIYAVIGLILLFWMGRWTRRTYHKLSVIMLLVSIVLLALVFTPLGF